MVFFGRARIQMGVRQRISRDEKFCHSAIKFTIDPVKIYSKYKIQNAVFARLLCVCLRQTKVTDHTVEGTISKAVTVQNTY